MGGKKVQMGKAFPSWSQKKHTKKKGVNRAPQSVCSTKVKKRDISQTTNVVGGTTPRELQTGYAGPTSKKKPTGNYAWRNSDRIPQKQKKEKK